LTGESFVPFFTKARAVEGREGKKKGRANTKENFAVEFI